MNETTPGKKSFLHTTKQQNNLRKVANSVLDEDCPQREPIPAWIEQKEAIVLDDAEKEPPSEYLGGDTALSTKQEQPESTTRTVTKIEPCTEFKAHENTLTPKQEAKTAKKEAKEAKKEAKSARKRERAEKREAKKAKKEAKKVKKEKKRKSIESGDE